MRAYWADLFCVPLPEAVARLERLAAREIRELERLDPETAQRHARLVAEIIEEARRLEAFMACAPRAGRGRAEATGTPRPSPSS